MFMLGKLEKQICRQQMIFALVQAKKLAEWKKIIKEWRNKELPDDARFIWDRWKSRIYGWERNLSDC